MDMKIEFNSKNPSGFSKISVEDLVHCNVSGDMELELIIKRRR